MEPEQKRKMRLKWIQYGVYLWMIRLGFSALGMIIPGGIGIWLMGSKSTEINSNATLSLPTFEFVPVLSYENYSICPFGIENMQYLLVCKSTLQPGLIRNVFDFPDRIFFQSITDLWIQFPPSIKSSWKSEFSYFSDLQPWAKEFSLTPTFNKSKISLTNTFSQSNNSYPFLNFTQSCPMQDSSQPHWYVSYPLLRPSSPLPPSPWANSLPSTLIDFLVSYNQYPSLPPHSPPPSTLPPSETSRPSTPLPSTPLPFSLTLWSASSLSSPSLHYDTDHNHYSQLSGLKQVLLVSPSLSRPLRLHSSLHPSWRQTQMRDEGQGQENEMKEGCVGDVRQIPSRSAGQWGERWGERWIRRIKQTLETQRLRDSERVKEMKVWEERRREWEWLKGRERRRKGGLELTPSYLSSFLPLPLPLPSQIDNQEDKESKWRGERIGAEIEIEIDIGRGRGARQEGEECQGRGGRDLGTDNDSDSSSPSLSGLVRHFTLREGDLLYLPPYLLHSFLYLPTPCMNQTLHSSPSPSPSPPSADPLSPLSSPSPTPSLSSSFETCPPTSIPPSLSPLSSVSSLSPSPSPSPNIPNLSPPHDNSSLPSPSPSLFPPLSLSIWSASPLSSLPNRLAHSVSLPFTLLPSSPSSSSRKRKLKNKNKNQKKKQEPRTMKGGEEELEEEKEREKEREREIEREMWVGEWRERGRGLALLGSMIREVLKELGEWGEDGRRAREFGWELIERALSHPSSSLSHPSSSFNSSHAPPSIPFIPSLPPLFFSVCSSEDRLFSAQHRDPHHSSLQTLALMREARLGGRRKKEGEGEGERKKEKGEANEREEGNEMDGEKKEGVEPSVFSHLSFPTYLSSVRRLVLLDYTEHLLSLLLSSLPIPYTPTPTPSSSLTNQFTFISSSSDPSLSSLSSLDPESYSISLLNSLLFPSLHPPSTSPSPFLYPFLYPLIIESFVHTCLLEPEPEPPNRNKEQ